MRATALQVSSSLNATPSSNSIDLYVPNSSEYDTFIDKDLLTPSYIVPTASGYYVGWFIDGYTHTLKGIEFKNDIATKLSLILNAQIKSNTPKSIKNSYYTKNKYHLNDLNNIEDLRKGRASNYTISGNDTAFDVIRAEAYKQKREGTLNYDVLLEWALRTVPSLLISKKSRSDIKSKVKNICRWTEKFYNAKTGSKRISTMTRTQASHYARTIRSVSKQEDVFNYLKTLNSMGTDITKLSFSFISKVLNIHRATATKYKLLFERLRGWSIRIKNNIPLIGQLKCTAIKELKKKLKKSVFITKKEYINIQMLVLIESDKSYKPILSHYLSIKRPYKQNIGD